MRTRAAIAPAIAFTIGLAFARADVPAAGMSLPVPAAELASAIGLRRADTANLPLDLVRVLYASPERAGGAHAAVQRLLDGTSGGTDRLPLPLGASLWRTQLLRENVPDERLAAAILGRRAPALLYHGLLGVDRETLDWLAQHPGALEALRRHPGAAAVFARSLRIRNGAIVTPGRDAVGIWTALVGAEPTRPESFIAHLFDARNGRLAFLFDTVMHLDDAHQRFALAPARGENVTSRARALVDAVTEASSSWRIEDRPFMRPDVDAALLLRLVGVTDEGTIEGIASRAVWERGFDGRLDSNLDAAGGARVDAAWLADKILRPPASVGRQRLDLFLLAQRVLPDAASAPAPRVLEALRGFTRYPALAVTLERNGVRGVAAYAAAAHAAGELQQDVQDLALSQSLIGLVDGARAAGTITREVSVALMTSLLDAAGSGHPAGPRLVQWTTNQLLPALKPATKGPRANSATIETIALNALGGPLSESPPSIEWEGHTYHVDSGAGERRRIERIRRTQEEIPLDRALQNASSPQGVRDLAESLTALLYAVALGEPDGQAATGGAVWRRHKFRADATAEDTAWRIAAENFGPSGWHLSGSLLALEAAMPRLALRRLDATSVPGGTQLSTSDRRTLALTIALMERPQTTDDAQAAIATAIARGRDRVRSLSSDPGAVAAAVRDAGLSEWRGNGVAWIAATEPQRLVSLFTLGELFRLGQGRTQDGAWGGAAFALDGSLALRPASDAWEEFAGRPATGQLGTQLTDVQLRTAEALAEFRLPASITRDIAAFVMQDVLDRAQPAYFDDFLSLAFAARDVERDRFEDYVAALTAAGPLVPVSRSMVAR